MIEGKVGYRYGNRVYNLEPGDSLFFDAVSPHGPQLLEQAAGPLHLGDRLPDKGNDSGRIAGPVSPGRCQQDWWHQNR